MIEVVAHQVGDRRIVEAAIRNHSYPHDAGA
jgi:hypothetical protein